MWPVAVDAGLPGRDRRRRLSVFHQARDVGAARRRAASNTRSPAPSAARPFRQRLLRGNADAALPRTRRRQLRHCAAADVARGEIRRRHRAIRRRPDPRGAGKGYAPAADFKAFSLNIGGFNAFVTGQPSEEAAKTAAVEQCQKRADTARRRANANSTPSATPSFTRMASRRCRRCPGSGMTP